MFCFAQADPGRGLFEEAHRELRRAPAVRHRNARHVQYADRQRSNEPVPDAQHQMALQQAAEHASDTRGVTDLSAEDLAIRSPTVRITLPADEEGPALVVKATTPSAVFIMTVAMASCSGLGALPFFFVGALSKEWAALANAVACGVMLAASFDLLHEGQPYGAGFVIMGLLSGRPMVCHTQLAGGVKPAGSTGAASIERRQIPIHCHCLLQVCSCTSVSLLVTACLLQHSASHECRRGSAHAGQPPAPC